MDEAAVADVHAHVPDAFEEDEVAGPESPPADSPAAAELPVGRSRQRDAEVRIAYDGMKVAL